MRKSIWILALVVLVSVSIAYAAASISITVPAASGVDKGIVNVTGDTTELLAQNGWIYTKSANTGNSSYVELNKSVTIVNSTGNSKIIFSFDSRLIEDSTTHTIYMIVGNSSTNYTDTNTGITIDNTVPGASTISSSVSGSQVTLSAAVNSKNITSCSAEFTSDKNPGSRSYTLVDSNSNTATYTLSDVSTGTYVWNGICTDGTNSTNSPASNSFTVTSSTGQSGLGGFLLLTGKGEAVTGSEIEIKGTGGIGGMSWKFILAAIGFIAGLFFILLPIPLIPAPLRPIVGAIILAILGYYLGGLI